MGLYDTLESTQVKLFTVPHLKVDYDYLSGEKDVLQVYTVGGENRYFSRGSRLPVATPWYFYGEDFIIFDYKGESVDNVEVQIVHKGIFVRNVKYTDIPSRISINLVVDKYGTPLKIRTKDDFRALKLDYDKYSREYFLEFERNEILKSFYLKLNSVKEYQKLEVVQTSLKEKELISEEEFNTWKTDIYNPEFNDLAKRTMEYFRKKWEYDEKSEIYKKINGGIKIGSYMHSILRYEAFDYNLDYHVLIHSLPYSIQCYQITKAFIEYHTKRNESINDLIDEYIDWCIKCQIKSYSKHNIISCINKYSKDMPENLIELQKEYERRIQNKC